jgi:hypothetical protein
MSNFFSELSNAVGKVKYQQYSISILSEQLKAIVPYENKQNFYDEIVAEKPLTKEEVISILKKYNGKLQ